MIKNVTDDIKYIGVDDLDLDLFESQYIVPEGMSYNSYLILDTQVAVMDSVDARMTGAWLENLETALEGRKPDYLVVHHMEPDHSGSILAFARKYPQAKIVASAKALAFLGQFFDGESFDTLAVKEGDVLELGAHTLRFFGAAMVHWPEVMVSFDAKDRVLFTADAFGKFGALGKCGYFGDEDDDWACEARRYYFNICGKYGAPVQVLLKKVLPLEPAVIAPLHGPVLRENLKEYDLSSLRYACTAGEALNAAVYDKFYAMTGLKLHEGFGQTETTLTLGTMPWMEPKPGSMGMPNPQYDIDLLRPDGTSCEDGEKGEIVVRTLDGNPIGLFKGYYRDEKLTQSVWHDGVYHTGDVAWRDEDGYYWFVGRVDDVIKSSGYRIGPFEVESALMTHPAVVECAITGVPDEIRGNVVKATVVLGKEWKAKAGPELIKELQNHVKHTTAPYKYPRIIEFVDELPKTISGKIRRVAIRERNKENASGKPGDSKPQDSKKG